MTLSPKLNPCCQEQLRVAMLHETAVLGYVRASVLRGVVCGRCLPAVDVMVEHFSASKEANDGS